MLRITCALVGLGLVALAVAASAQDPPSDGWRSPSGTSPASPPNSAPGGARTPETLTQLQPVNRDARVTARVTKGTGTLPNDHGQVWREYDITPYTMRVTSTNAPEQAIVDWILRETGYEAWHSEPLGILSATKKSLRVYHTPEVQTIVADIADRFVSSQAETQAFGLRIMTIGNPNWRAKALPLMKPVPVQSQGVQGWLMAKESAALLLAELQKRSDFREHSSPHLLVNNGQSTVVSTIQPRRYVRGVLLRDGAWPGFEPDYGQIEQGYALEFNPLLSLDMQTVDAVIKLRMTQLEKMVPVMLEIPTPAAPRQRVPIEVPQVAANNLHERFRWPTDQVLLLSMGVVATPAPTKGNPITDALAPLTQTPNRADALLMIECKGQVTLAPGARPNVSGAAYPARY